MQNRFLTWWHARWKVTRFLAYVALILWTNIIADLIFGVPDSLLVDVLVGAALGGASGMFAYWLEISVPIKQDTEQP